MRSGAAAIVISAVLMGCGATTGSTPESQHTQQVPANADPDTWHAIEWPQPMSGPAFDTDEDNLPEGAIGRLGSRRFAHGGAPASEYGPSTHPVGLPDGKRVLGVALETDNLVALFDVETGEQQQVLDAHTARVTTLAVSPDGRRLASGDAEGQIVIWSGSGEFETTLRGNTAAITALSFSADGKWLVAGAADSAIGAWDLSAGKEVALVNFEDGSVFDVGISDDSSIFAGCTVNGFGILNTDTAELVEIDGFESFTPNAIAFRGDDLILGGEDRVVVIDLTTRSVVGQTVVVEEESEHGLDPLAVKSWVLRSRSELFAQHRNGRIERVWLDGRAETFSEGWGHLGSTLAPLGGDRMVISSSIRWGVIGASGDIVPPQPGHLTRIQKLAWSADGAVLFAVDRGNRLGIWDADTRRPIRFVDLSIGSFSDLAVDPTNHFLAFSGTRSVQIMELPNGEPRTVLETPLHGEGYGTNHWKNLSFSKDGRILAASRDNDDYTGDVVVRLDPESGENLKQYTVLNDEPDREDVELVTPVIGRSTYFTEAASTSPDGRMTVSIHTLGDLTLWIQDNRSGRAVEYPLDSLPSRLQYNPDGSRIAVAMGNGDLVIYPSPTAPKVPEAGKECIACLGRGGALGTCDGQEDNCQTACFESEACAEPVEVVRACIADSGCETGDATCVSLACGKTCEDVLGKDACELDGVLAGLAQFRRVGDPANSMESGGDTLEPLFRYGSETWRAAAPLKGLMATSDQARVLGVDDDGAVTVWAADSGTALRRMKIGDQYPDSREYGLVGTGLVAKASQHSPRGVFLWDVKTGTLVDKILLSRPGGDWSAVTVTGADHSVAWSNGTTVTVRDLSADKDVTVDVKDFPPDRIALSPDGTLLATAGGGGELRVWDTADGTLQASAASSNEFVDRLVISPDGALLVVTALGQQQTYTVSGLVAVPELSGKDLALVFGPGSELMMVEPGGDVALLDQDYSETARISTGLGSISGLLIMDGELLTSSQHSSLVRRWDLETGREEDVGQEIHGKVKGIEIAGGSTCGCSLSDVVVWQHQAPVTQLVFDGNDQVLGCGLSPDGARLAVAVARDVNFGGYRPAFTPEVLLYQVGGSDPIERYEVDDLVRDLGTDGTTVRALVGFDEQSYVDATNSKHLANAESAFGAIAPGGRYGLSVSEREGESGIKFADKLMIDDLQRGTRHEVDYGGASTNAFGFSPNGEWVSVFDDDQVLLVELATGDETRVGFTDTRSDDGTYPTSRGVVPSSDGTQLAMFKGNQVTILDVGSGEETSAFRTGDADITTMSYDAQGQLYTGLANGNVLVFDPAQSSSSSATH